MDYKTYDINGKIYEHRPQVLGQLKQLENLLKGTSIPAGADAWGLLSALGEKTPHALAIILTEKGKSPAEKDIDTLAEEMAWGMDIGCVLEIVTDFFSINPLSSVFEKVVGLLTMVTDQVLAIRTGIPASASSSEEVI
ncbi:MAG: hypothetical protein KBG09_06370 [Syntrophobacterales bacterium]|jgi:hypothetical protein|nr:hypothetical protein [Syntrophobacterales bacterium]